MIGIVCAFFHTEGKGFYSKLRKKWWGGEKGTNPEEVCNIRRRQRGQGNFELNSHARLACYTMNKTGVASGSFS